MQYTIKGNQKINLTTGRVTPATSFEMEQDERIKLLKQELDDLIFERDCNDFPDNNFLTKEEDAAEFEDSGITEDDDLNMQSLINMGR